MKVHLNMPGKRPVNHMDTIFRPDSVALIGASDKPGKIGKLYVDRFLEMGFTKFYPVNPGGCEIPGVPSYRKVTDIPEPVDMAIIVVPTSKALSAVEECAQKKVKTVVMTTSGFSESGPEGKKLEDEIVGCAKKTGMRIIGPNCIGLYCPSSNLPFPQGAGSLPGSVGVLSQSGFFADFLTKTSTANGIHFSKAISYGNECDLNAVDFLTYLGEDEETKLIVSYIEGVKNAAEYYKTAKNVSKKKPIILWKGGVTEGGAKAAVSHTGAMAGSREIWQGALRQAGVVSVSSFEEVVDCLHAFHMQPVPKGKRVCIISGPGGMAVSATDRCLELGLRVPQFSAATEEKLKKVLPPVGGSIKNPVDLSMGALLATELYRDAVKILVEDENVDMILVIALKGEKLIDHIIQASEWVNGRKPFMVALLEMDMPSMGVDFPLLLSRGVTVYPDASRAVKALWQMARYGEYRRRRACGEKALA